MLFKKKKKKLKEIISSADIGFTPIYHNDAIAIVHDACIVCVDGKKERTLDEKVKFISDKVKIGHESILEHSNYIVLLNFTGNPDNLEAYMDILECFKYLNVKAKIYQSDGEPYGQVKLLIGGSARAYKHLIRTCNNHNNPIYKTLLEYIQYAIPSCFFSDLIQDNVLKELDFLNLYSDDDYKNIDYKCNTKTTTIDDGIILYVDNIYDIYKRLDGVFDSYELMDFCMVNTLFHNVSRACSHQIVRHRNGVTQLSQRYVDMKNAPMILPPLDIPSQAKNEMVILLDQIVNKYTELVDKYEMKKEDARYLLPNACATTLYMTFTFRNFLKAYQLRTGKGAQREIHIVFDKLYSGLEKYWETQFDKDLESCHPMVYLEPKLVFDGIEADKNLESKK